MDSGDKRVLTFWTFLAKKMYTVVVVNFSGRICQNIEESHGSSAAVRKTSSQIIFCLHFLLFCTFI